MGRIRIVAGEFRGRRIEVPDAAQVRPTADRVREALFNILAGRVPGAHVLDLYAGSGALGLEALSRGADAVVFVENDAEVARTLRANVSALGAGGRTTVVVRDVVRFVDEDRSHPAIDLVLADPPYASRATAELLGALSRSGRLAAGAVVAVEGEARDPVPAAAPPLVHARRATYGRVALDFFRIPDCPESE